MKIKKKSLAAVLAAAMLVTGVTAVFATSQAPEPAYIDELPQAAQSDPPPFTDPAPAQKPALTPGASAAILPEPAPEQVPEPAEPVDTTPAAAEPPVVEPAAEPVEPAAGPTEPTGETVPAGASAWALEAWGPITCWGLPDGPLPEGTVLHARTEEEYRETIRQIRLKGYSGFFSLVGQPADNWYIAILDQDFDGVQRTLTPPTGITADWTYPTNSKGETYGTMLGFNALGYNPDLVSAMASNGQSGYMLYSECSTSPWRGKELDGDYNTFMKAQPKVRKIPVYDVDRNTILGYFEQANTYSAEYVTPPEMIESVIATIEAHHRELGYSEEEIAQVVSSYKAERGWN